MIQEPFRIDVHHHIVPPEYAATLSALGVKGGGGIDFPHWDPQSSLSMMDRQSIATAITSLQPGVYFGDCALARDLARRFNDAVADTGGAGRVVGGPDHPLELRELGDEFLLVEDVVAARQVIAGGLRREPPDEDRPGGGARCRVASRWGGTSVELRRAVSGRSGI